MSNGLTEADVSYKVSVRSLAAFSAKSGSLDRRFTPGPSAQEGMEGHKRVAQNRTASYQTEISLSIVKDRLLIRGRADGFHAEQQCLEEIKTFYGDYERIPENHRALHWAQLCIYGWIYCLEHQLDQIRLALVYFQLEEEREYRDEQVWQFDSLKSYCLKLIQTFSLWRDQIDQRQRHLKTWLEQLAFPFPEFHSSQREMAEAVYKSVVTGRVLLAEAPTGTGKTLASLFPALKAMIRKEIDQIYYLTAKTTGKQLALDALTLIGKGNDIPLRVIELTAQEKACLEPDKQCHGDSCPYARDFYTKLEKARQAAYQIPILDKNALESIAQEHEICPFYLSMEMCQWVDVVVADVNYYFDGSPLLLNMVKEENASAYLLIDECHNLIERARMMYSANLSRNVIRAAKKEAPAVLSKSLERINRQWLKITKPLEPVQGKLTCLLEIPAAFIDALDNFSRTYQEYLQLHAEDLLGFNHLRDCFFEVLAFQRACERINSDFCVDVQNLNTPAETITVRNLIPATQVAERLSAAKGAALFSATLTPMDFYQIMLGLPENTVHLKVKSPFTKEQLDIKVAHYVSTHYHQRKSSIEKVVDIIKNQLKVKPGNAMVYFSSYTYLRDVEMVLRERLAELPIEIHAQSKSMSDLERRVFIGRFRECSNVLGLAVLGGVFSEGIDLVGDSLNGVFVVTLGLPQVNEVNEFLREFLDERYQQGYEFTYLYPGIQKVIQAAGRVIRTKQDVGYLWLLDKRYRLKTVRQLLPEWWMC